MELQWKLKRLTTIVRSAISSLLDQSQPYGRLALLHCLQGAGSSLITISLAGSLFFSISPNAAKDKVLLYLVLTIAPFAIVGPALSPLLDRGRQARRTSAALASGGSAVLCLAMAKNIHDVLLFPEAFGVLVLAKLYLVAKAALVPGVVEQGDDLASANAKLAVLASLSGFAALPFGVALLKIGAPWVLRLGAAVFLAGVVAAVRLPRPKPLEPAEGTSTRSAMPLRKVTAERRRFGLPLYRKEVTAALMAMSIGRASVGFSTFFLAFALRRAHASTLWFGALLVASGAGSLLGSMVVPRLRRNLSERQIILCGLGLITLGGVLAGFLGGLWSQLLLTFAVGAGPTGAKPALDSIVQRSVAPALLGRAFGRLETRLQLFWVLAALLAVLIPFPLSVGDGFVAGACAFGAVYYLLTPFLNNGRAGKARSTQLSEQPLSD